MGDFDCCADGDHDTTPYTPDTPTVKAAYTRAMRDSFVASASEHDMEFDRWLCRVRSTAWFEGVNAQWKHRPLGNHVVEFENPYGVALSPKEEKHD